MVREKFLALVEWFRAVEGILMVSFSGGLDSSVVLATAVLTLGSDKVIAVTAVSPIRLKDELMWARTLADMYKVRHIVIESDELSDPDFITNPVNRCYICKKRLARKLLDLARGYNVKTIVDGSTASDRLGFRPGQIAFKEAGVRSPLMEVGITKEEAALIAKALSLPNWDVQPMSCLVTRIPYGELITVERLSRIEEAERRVKELVGAKVVRVRDHGLIARIEVGRDERRKFYDEKVMDEVVHELRRLGYKYVTLDLQGYRSGSFDDTVSNEVLKVQSL